MTISWIQAILLGIFASLSSMPGMGGSSIGNYTLGRPLVGGLISGLILGDVTTGIMVGVALQVVYIALVTPGGTVSADVRAISYIGIPLSILFVHANNITGEAAIAAAAAPIGAAVGTIGTVLFYGTATMNLLWQHIGWDSIIYLAALSAIDPTYYEAATMDGASRMQKILNIDLPLLLPTAMILLILRAGSLLSIGFEKVLLLQNPLNLAGSEVISTYVYKVGMLNFQYSYSTAIGLFNTVVNLIILLSVNWFSKRYTKTGLF